MSSAPQISYRDASGNPLAVILYSQSSLGGNNIPVLQGEESNPLILRIYNNFALAAGIATAFNVSLTVFDGVGSGSHTCAVVPVSQSWVSVQLYGYGENSTTTPDLFSYFVGTKTAIGGSSPCGSNAYVPERGSNGGALPLIRAYNSGSGMGYLELQTTARLPVSGVQNQTYNFALSMMYEYIL